MMQEKRIEPIVAVEDHCGVSDVAMGDTPFAPVTAEWRQGIRQGKKKFLMNSLYILVADIGLTTRVKTNQFKLLKIKDRQVTGRCKSSNRYIPIPSMHV